MCIYNNNAKRKRDYQLENQEDIREVERMEAGRSWSGKKGEKWHNPTLIPNFKTYFKKSERIAYIPKFAIFG